MLTLIHSDDTIASRKALNDLKEKHPDSEKIIFDGTKVTLTDIVSASDSLSLFSREKLIIIENFINASVSKEKEEILQFLKESKSSAHVVFFEQKEIGGIILKKYFSSAKVIFSQIPPVLFKFLDSINEKPLPDLLSMFQKLRKEREGEFTLSMLIRQWRYLIIAADLGETGLNAMPAWQAYKFIKQAKHFSLKNLVSSYRQLLSMDLKVKSGLTAYSLNDLLDIFFISLYYGF